MANPQDYKRDANGTRFQPGGIDTVHAADALPANKYLYLQNVRAYKQQQIIGRATVGSPVVSGLPSPVHSLRMLNDTTPGSTPPYYVRVIGAAGEMWVDSTKVASGFNGGPVSICPFRPNTSVKPYAYLGNASQAVTITADPSHSDYVNTGAIKIRSDGVTNKTGIKEPQLAPDVSTQDYTTSETGITLPATSIPWTNQGGANSDYGYSQTTGTAPIIIRGGAAHLVSGALVTISVSGSANVNGGVAAPDTTGPTTGAPGNYATSGANAVVIGAFTDDQGNVIASGGAQPSVFFIGVGTTVTVPNNATQVQVGINTLGGSFNSNSGSFTLDWSVTVNAIATVLSTIGDVTAYVWGRQPTTLGGSPQTGPVAQYIWKNPNDAGSGIPRSITSPVPDVVPTSNSWHFDSTPRNGTVPVEWNVLSPDGSVASSINLFNPQLQSAGYQDFNCCITGNLFVPAEGTYQLDLQYKDQIMFGIGGGASTVAGPAFGTRGQSRTVVKDLPLLFVSTPNGGDDDPPPSTSLFVYFPSPGIYEVEIDWDYWYRLGRALIMTSPSSSPHSPTIPPLAQNVRTGVQYRYVYRSSTTGALSNPSPESILQSTPVLANLVQSYYSDDPQVDKVDYYRLDDNLTSFTYVATGPNDGAGGSIVINGVTYHYNTPIEDELTDTDINGNQLLQFDNYEPFPITDIPKKGFVNVTGGVITVASGDTFNTRWLPGTEILIGSPTATAYTFVSRPISSTQVVIPGTPDGTGLEYEITEPILAAQPLPCLWGPTDNSAFMFACGDEDNPGTLYFTKGNNPDSAPETNQIAVTSPAEPLMNGCITAGMGMVFSTEKRWLIYPTFTTALATVQGIAGNPFYLVLASSERGLYMRFCLCTDGGNNTFFRAKDGIYVCQFGGGDKFICEDIYNLFPREGFTPQPITIAGQTIYPPDDSRINAQRLSYANGYLYYDYADVNGNQRTLVYDQIAGGWSVDVGEFPFTIHAVEEGPETNATMVGCNDGSVRVLGFENPEDCISVVIPGAQNGGDARAFKRLGDVFVKAIAVNSNPITVALYANRYAIALAGVTPATLTGTGSLDPYILNFTSGDGGDLIDVGIVLSWPTTTADLLDLWSPTFVQLPESVQGRPTDWSDGGFSGAKFVQGVRIERNTFGADKTFKIQSADDLTLHTPNEMPCNFNGQSIKAFSVSPFIAHSLRIVSTDGVPWNEWGTEYMFQPYPEQCLEWSTELMAFTKGWQHVRMFNIPYIAAAPVTLRIFFDQWPTITLTDILPATASQLYPTKTKVQCPASKSKLMGFSLTSSALWRPFKTMLEVWVGEWGRLGPYQIVQPFGGNSSDGAEV